MFGAREVRLAKRGTHAAGLVRRCEVATIEKSIDVDVPVSVAYGQWTQFEEFPQFMEGVVEVHQIDDSHLRWVAEVGDERREWTAEIFEQQPDRVIGWRSVDGVPMTGRVAFAPRNGGSRVTVEMEYDAEGVKEHVGALVGMDGRQVESDLERFKELVERRGSATGEWSGEIRSGRVVERD